MRWYAKLYATPEDQLELIPAEGLLLQDVDWGHPRARVVSYRRGQVNGTIDQTALFGERTITIAVGVAHEMQDPTQDGLPHDDYVMDKVMRWMNPENRFWLYLYENGYVEKRYKVRPNRVRRRLNVQRRSRFLIPPLQFVAYEGVAESPTLKKEVITASAANEEGRVYDKTYDKVYPASDPIGEKPIWNMGTAPAIPQIRIYGPTTDPKLENVTVGKAIVFKSGFSLATGEWLAIDPREGTIWLNGDPANDRFYELDFTQTDWWEVEEGENLLRFESSAGSPPEQVQIDWYDTFF